MQLLRSKTVYCKTLFFIYQHFQYRLCLFLSRSTHPLSPFSNFKHCNDLFFQQCLVLTCLFILILCKALIVCNYFSALYALPVPSTTACSFGPKLTLSTWQTKIDTCANSVDPDEMACNDHLIRIYTVCHSFFSYFRLRPLLA